ncbi:MAG: Asp-tRNA(Asn)/Glu-tRNA(Gln) amidotransferase subunit GatC [Patescibacteria group bacterium]|nr:Asp-tRNA(Asn)/Glu-tRNA(Gln) amidotransferase subunit GatC [Patescibacteria group bacterium]
MGVTRNDVRKIAQLARLDFTPEEEERLTGELNEILNYMEQLNELDTSKIEPLSHIIEMGNVFRDDIVQPSLSPEEALMNAPNRFNNYFTVPKVLD